MNSVGAVLCCLWHLYFLLRVRGDALNLPPLLICPYLNDSHAALLCRRLGCRLLRAGNAPPGRYRPRFGAIYLGDLDAGGIKQLLQQARENPQIRWCVVVEDAPAAENTLGKFNRQAMEFAVQIGDGTFVPVRLTQKSGQFGRPLLAIRLGRPSRLPAGDSTKDSRLLSRHLVAALESCAAEIPADNIPRAFVCWAKKYGWGRPLFLDFQQPSLSYRRLYRSAWALGAVIAAAHAPQKRIGVLLPATTGAAVVFYAAVFWRLTPVMLNLNAGPRNVLSACQTAVVHTVYTSQKLLDKVPATAVLTQVLRDHGIKVVCLESLRPHLTLPLKLRAVLAALLPARSLPSLPGAAADGDEAAAVLFTSGSEGHPKGVALSHHNLLANTAQVLARIDNLHGEKMLNCLPIFHSFGLLAGVLLPAAGGITTLQYPNPLHYRQIPEIIYRFRPGIFFSTNAFLTAYAREAHPLDLGSLRWVFAGAEKLKESTRRCWAEKFGVRILEGYGVTETSPVIAVNAPGENRPGTVGRPLANIETRLVPIAGIKDGGQLWVRGPNVMLGYFNPENPGTLKPPADGWHDTGDIVEIDGGGFLRIKGRTRRFIKIAGEMVPLDGIEEALSQKWPATCFAVVSLPEQNRGEQIIALTDNPAVTRESVAEKFKQAGLPPLWVPRRLVAVAEIPQLPTGKTDYPAAQKHLSPTTA